MSSKTMPRLLIKNALLLVCLLLPLQGWACGYVAHSAEGPEFATAEQPNPFPLANELSRELYRIAKINACPYADRAGDAYYELYTLLKKVEDDREFRQRLRQDARTPQQLEVVEGYIKALSVISNYLIPGYPKQCRYMKGRIEGALSIHDVSKVNIGLAGDPELIPAGEFWMAYRTFCTDE